MTFISFPFLISASFRQNFSEIGNEDRVQLKSKDRVNTKLSRPMIQFPGIRRLRSDLKDWSPQIWYLVFGIEALEARSNDVGG